MATPSLFDDLDAHDRANVKKTTKKKRTGAITTGTGRSTVRETGSAPTAGAARTNGSAPIRRRADAHSMAAKQREISVSEFFTKNRHLLGFDSPLKALLTAVKEAVDNSLDACEEAGILPELRVELTQTAENRFRNEHALPMVPEQSLDELAGSGSR